MSKTLLSATTNFLYDGPNPVQEQNGSGVTANLLTGGIDERFQRTDSTGAYSYLTDALGSTEALTNSTGAQQVTYSYSPYGSMSISGSTTNSYDYTGRESDGLGLHYYRARYYNPNTGRFLSEDPIGFRGGGPNYYAYAYDDPIDYRDPYGKDPVVGATTGAIMGGFYGAWGAWTTGGNGWDVAEGALLGAGLGFGLGFVDPSFGGAVVLGGLAGAGGDALGQWITNRNHGTSCYNVPEMLGAGIGGGLGGATGFGLGATANAAGLADTWSFNFANQFLSGVPGYVGATIGWAYGEQNGDEGGKGTSGRKDQSNSSGCH